MRIAILGANGQIGRLVFGAVQKQFPQAEVLACVRKSRLHFEGISGNQLQRSLIFSPLKNKWQELGRLDVIINCIGAIHDAATSYEEVHVLPVQSLLEARTQLGNPRVLHFSALGAAGHSPSAFMRSKAKAERLVLEQEDTFVIRPSIVCTPDTMLVKAILSLKQIAKFTGGSIPFPAGFLQTKIQPVAARDLSDVVCSLIWNGSEMRSIDLVGAEQFSINDLLQTAGLRPFPVPQKISDALRKVLKYLPLRLLNDEQYQLLKHDNCSATGAMQTCLKRKSASTRGFWEAEFSITKKEIARRKREAFSA